MGGSDGGREGEKEGGRETERRASTYNANNRCINEWK